MTVFCPWCGAPIPHQLHRVEHTQTAYFDHMNMILCIRCGEKTYFLDDGLCSDKEIARVLEEEDEGDAEVEKHDSD